VTRTKDDILQDAKGLSIRDRAELAAALISSLDGEPEADVAAAWAEEIERRAGKLAAGTANARPWSEVRRDLERRHGT